MKKKFWFTFIMFITIYGCSSTKFTPVTGLERESISSRSVPAKVSRESDKVLEKKGYAQIGFVYSDDKVKTCWGDDCVNFTCTPDTPHKDLSKEVLEKAASHGGDIVVLEKDSAPSIESTTKDGKCLSSYRTSYQDQECSGGYGNVPRVCSWVTKYRYECTAYETIHGKACTFVSNGSVWRHDPEIGKRLEVILRELREKERLKNAEREKKENEAKRVRAHFPDLKREYESNVVPWYMKKDKHALESTQIGESYGFKDKNGIIVIQPKFSDSRSFSEGLAAVAMGEKEHKKWGYINKTGKWVVLPSFYMAGDFSEGLANVAVVENGNARFGFIDNSGKWVLAPDYEYADSFSEGLAKVIIKQKAGYINKAGQFVINPSFAWALDFAEGFAPVKTDKKGKVGYIDKTGTMVIPPQFDFAGPFSEGMAVVEIDHKHGYIDKTGSIIISPQFTGAEKFYKGIARVGAINKQYIDKFGAFIY